MAWNDDVLKCVHMQADVYMVCLQHALSTDKEEVMGLLIGEVSIHVCQIFVIRSIISYFIVLY